MIMHRMLHNRKGFTLVELAIVLVIIGILLGSVLKGAEMIRTAKYKRLYSQYREVAAATYTYYDKYQKYPGDDPNAVGRWAGIAVVAGNNNGFIDGTQYCNGGEATESCIAWQELRASQILTGSTAVALGRQSPSHAFGGRIALGRLDAVPGMAAWMQPFGVCFENLDNDTARWLELNYDDGVYNTGSVRGDANYMAGVNTAVVAQWTCMNF
jgi:prepilin-type N-terminal cleavage/methylation domain-containing protein